MGKESKLRSGFKSGETRHQYTNGDRKFYDSDQAPAGADEYVWSLALYFEQRLEPFGGKSITPVTYTRLYERVSKDPDLTKLLDSGSLYTKGEGGKPLVTSGTKVHSKKDLITLSNKYLLVEYMIDKYFDYYDSNSIPSIEYFTSYTYFNYLKDIVIEEEYLKLLKISGTKVPVITTGTPQPDKRTKEDQEILDITVNRVYTESDMREMFDKFKGGQSTSI